MKVTEALERFPELTPSAEVVEWLASVKQRWIGSVSTIRYDGRGWLVLKTLAGPIPEPLLEGAVEHDGRLLTPLTLAAAQTLRAQRSAHLDIAAERCLQVVEHGGDPPAGAAGLRARHGRRGAAPGGAVGPGHRPRLR